MSDPIGYADFVKTVIGALNAAGVEYLVGGAVATWAWGEPRATMDLDLVVNIPKNNAARLSKELKKRDILVPEEIILDKLMEDRADIPINAIHAYSGYKADMYPLRPGDELRETAFRRRILVDLGPQLGELYLHTPEDLIIYKLTYYSLSQQTKHLRDITAIVITIGDELDYEYIEKWMDRKGLVSLWNEMLGGIQSQFEDS